MSFVIEVGNLSRTFQIRKGSSGFLGSVLSLVKGKSETLHAVSSISFQIKEGELVGYLGPNGAGKSTTIKMLTGILMPSSGKITVAGYDPVAERKKVTQQIGVVFGQKSQLWWDLPVEESFELLKSIYRIPQKTYLKQKEMLCELLGVGDFLRQQTRKLSLGQRMRADLVASLIHNPPVLFLDEPTIGLDILTKERVRGFIKQINRLQKTTVLLTTHDMDDIEALASRIILLDEGRIRYDGAIDEFTARFASDPRLTIHLESPADASLFSSYHIVRVLSSSQYEILLPSGEDMSGVIEHVMKSGWRIKEILVRKQDLGETLKLLYQKDRHVEL